jgi:hypothetical protein
MLEKLNQDILNEILGSHGFGYDDNHLPVCYAVQYDGNLQTFQNNLLNVSRVLIILTKDFGASEMSVEAYIFQTELLNVPEDSNIQD